MVSPGADGPAGGRSGPPRPGVNRPAASRRDHLLLHLADRLNHIHPRRGQHWSGTVCLYASELRAAREGYIAPVTFRSALRLSRRIRALRTKRGKHAGLLYREKKPRRL